MRILFVIDALDCGGKERRMMELMKGLKKRSEVHFELVVLSNSIFFKEVFNFGITIHTLIRKGKRDISVFKKIYAICKNYRPNIIHCWDGMSAVYLVPIAKLLKIKLVNGMINDAPANFNFKHKNWIRAKITFPFSDIIISNSHTGLAAYKAPVKKSVCIPNGFDFGRIEALEINTSINIKSKYVVGMVATFSKYKDYNTYFSAANMLLETRRDITFLAIGRDTDSLEAKSLIRKEFSSHFQLLGTRSDVEALVNLMDVCVLATFTEGISNSILEYMALGKPVIATLGGGTKEIVKDNITGFTISPGNPAELAEKINLLLDNEALRRKMGTSGKQRICDSFSIDNMVNNFVANYRKLAKG